MQNPLLEIYQTVYTKIKEIDPTKYWFDIDMGQFDIDGSNLPITYPAILLRFEDVIWKDRDMFSQIGLVNITIKYAHRFKSESEMIAGNSPRQEIQDCLQILQTIHGQLNKISGSSFSAFTRFNQYHQKTNPKDLLWVNVIQYQCNIQSNGGIDSPELLITDFDDVRNNNVFLERRKYNLMHK
jgi:hypothetical protein